MSGLEVAALVLLIVCEAVFFVCVLYYYDQQRKALSSLAESLREAGILSKENAKFESTGCMLSLGAGLDRTQRDLEQVKEDMAMAGMYEKYMRTDGDMMFVPVVPKRRRK